VQIQPLPYLHLFLSIVQHVLNFHPGNSLLEQILSFFYLQSKITHKVETNAKNIFQLDMQHRVKRIVQDPTYIKINVTLPTYIKNSQREKNMGD
jgi:hypothetical protein